MPQPNDYDPIEAKAAYDQFLPRIQGLNPADCGRYNLDVEEAGLRAIATGGEATAAGTYEAFASLPAAHFDIRHVDELAPLGWAALYLHKKQQQSRVVESRAMIPLELFERATEIKGRMLDCGTYYLSGHAEAGPELADIRRGTGYRDLALDLARLVDVYEAHDATLSVDTVHYRSDDAAAARKASNEIYAELGQSGGWRDDEAARIKTLIALSYHQVVRGARFLYDGDATQLARFPALLAR